MPPGLSNLTIGPLGAECRGGCSASVTLAVARAAPGAQRSAAPLPGVPTSRLFEPLGPHTPHGSTQIVVPEVRRGRHLTP